MNKKSLNWVQPISFVKLDQYIGEYEYMKYSRPILIYEIHLNPIDVTNYPLMPSCYIEMIICYDYQGKAKIIYIGSQQNSQVVALSGFSDYIILRFEADHFYYSDRLLDSSTQTFLKPSFIKNQIHTYSIEKSENNVEYQFIQNLISCHNFTERKKSILNYLSTYCKTSQMPPTLSKTMNYIRKKEGKTSISSLASKFGYSERHLDRLFSSNLGFSPKEYCRYIRFQHTLINMLKHPFQKISEYIEDSGYYDQSHFQSEFKAFTGMTPRKYMQLIQNHHISDTNKGTDC